MCGPLVFLKSKLTKSFSEQVPRRGHQNPVEEGHSQLSQVIGQGGFIQLGKIVLATELNWSSERACPCMGDERRSLEAQKT